MGAINQSWRVRRPRDADVQLPDDTVTFTAVMMIVDAPPAVFFLQCIEAIGVQNMHLNGS
jgi:hypothetical protein